MKIGNCGQTIKEMSASTPRSLSIMFLQQGTRQNSSLPWNSFNGKDFNYFFICGNRDNRVLVWHRINRDGESGTEGAGKEIWETVIKILQWYLEFTEKFVSGQPSARVKKQWALHTQVTALGSPHAFPVWVCHAVLTQKTHHSSGKPSLPSRTCYFINARSHFPARRNSWTFAHQAHFQGQLSKENFSSWPAENSCSRTTKSAKKGPEYGPRCNPSFQHYKHLESSFRSPWDSCRIIKLSV